MTAQMDLQAAAVEVVEAFAEGRANRRVIVGNPVTEGAWTTGPDGVRRRILGFAAGTRFVLDCWERNDYGTTRWRVVVCESAVAGSPAVAVPAVRPAVRLLADVQGASRVRFFLAWLRLQGDRIDRFTASELSRIELHFQRMPLARLRAITGRQSP